MIASGPDRSDFLNFLRTNDRLQEEPLFADNTGIYALGAHFFDISDTPYSRQPLTYLTPHLTGNATQPVTGNATQPMAPSEQAVQQTADNQPTELRQPIPPFHLRAMQHCFWRLFFRGDPGNLCNRAKF